MSIAAAERLKQVWTDKPVLVKDGVPELRRFQGLVGMVKTVNMNGRCLVEFKGREDIGWYDIAPECLLETTAELPASASQVVPEPSKASRPAGKGTAAAGKTKAGLSPLELARQQGAAKPEQVPVEDGPQKTEAATTQNLSPLELARQQGAAKSENAKTEQSTAQPESATGQKLSPLELARQQGAAKPKAGEPTEQVTPASSDAAIDSPPVGSGLLSTSHSAESAPESPQSEQKSDRPPRPQTLFNASPDESPAPAGPVEFRGKKIKPDDLKVVEGIGPKIESLLKEAGITTWRALSQTDPVAIEKILVDAGPRFRMHTPTTWPDQAGMAADGKWNELQTWQDSHTAGRE